MAVYRARECLTLILVPLPPWLAGHVDESLKPSLFAVSLVALVYLAIPWRYVWVRYVKAPGDRWRLSPGKFDRANKVVLG